jgi:hypothetical protein
MTAEQRPDIETLALAIACSPIVVARAKLANKSANTSAKTCQSARVPLLPEGFDDADLAILRWIAEEGRRAGRPLFRH